MSAEMANEDKLTRFFAAWGAEFRQLDKDSGIDAWVEWVGRPDVDLDRLVSLLRKIRVENLTDFRYRPFLAVVQKRYVDDSKQEADYRVEQGAAVLRCGLCKDSGFMYVVEGGDVPGKVRLMHRDRPEYHSCFYISVIPCKCSKGRRAAERPRWQAWPTGTLDLARELCGFRAATEGPPDFGLGPAERFVSECRSLLPAVEKPEQEAVVVSDAPLAEAVDYFMSVLPDEF